MIVRYYLRRAVSRPPHRLALRLVGLAGIHGRRQVERWRDSALPTFLNVPASATPHQLFHRILVPELEPYAAALHEDAQRTLEHRFDLLGSGPVCLNLHEADCGTPPGPENRGEAGGGVNPGNREAARRLLAGLSSGYRRIDWHRDARSGFRWASDVPYDAIRYGDRPGVEVKFPWELSRLQHLPRLALAYQLAQAGIGSAAPADAYFREFRDQVIDFRAANPPRFGVNWTCAMDVGIRTINLIAAHDLFRAAGAVDDDLTAMMVAMIREHAHHLRTNLEWSTTGRGNHYLCNIAGLLFAGCWLPRNRRTGAWLRFAWRELQSELDLQFNPDGSNIEGSTIYHRLSAEAVLWCVAAICGVAAERRDPDMGRPDHLGPKLQAMADFTRAITKPDDLVPQIGDNDSGRVLKPLPDTALSDLDHRGFVSAVDRLLGTKACGPSIETGMVKSLAQGATLPSIAPRKPDPGSFGDFGIHILREGSWHVVFRCGGGGWRTGGNHTHNDQLSFELTVDGQAIIVDTGTYIYTPWPDRRNRFRSTAMHNTLQLGDQEQNPWLPGNPGLFRLENHARAQLLHRGDRILEGVHYGFDSPHRRRLTLTEDALLGLDRCEGRGLKSIFFHLDPSVTATPCDGGVSMFRGNAGLRLEIDRSCSAAGGWSIEVGEVSRRYGEATPATVIVWRGHDTAVAWSIRRI